MTAIVPGLNLLVRHWPTVLPGCSTRALYRGESLLVMRKSIRSPQDRFRSAPAASTASQFYTGAANALLSIRPGSHLLPFQMLQCHRRDTMDLDSSTIAEDSCGRRNYGKR